MKRKKTIIIGIISVAIVLLIAAFVIIKTGWNSRIELPSAGTVQRIEMELKSYDAGLSVATADNQEYIEAIISELSKARKASLTWYSAANDAPQLREYLTMLIEAERGGASLYLYYENDRYYVYAPYIGIYKIDQKTGFNIHQLFVMLQPKTQGRGE